jgi:hypothetical protein
MDESKILWDVPRGIQLLSSSSVVHLLETRLCLEDDFLAAVTSCLVSLVSRIRMVALVNAADAILEARKRRESVIVGSEIQNALVSRGGFASNFGTLGDDTRTSRIVAITAEFTLFSRSY